MDVFQLCDGLKFILCPHTEAKLIRGSRKNSPRYMTLESPTLWSRRYDIYKAAPQSVGWCRLGVTTNELDNDH